MNRYDAERKPSAHLRNRAQDQVDLMYWQPAS